MLFVDLEEDLGRLQIMFENTPHWSFVEGCKYDRWYINDMKSNAPSFHRLAAKMMDQVRLMIQCMHPSHKFITFFILGQKFEI